MRPGEEGPDTHAELRDWARGAYGEEAAVELLIRGFGGRFCRAYQPWVRDGDGGLWIDWDRMAEELGYLSGGERRYLSFASAMAGKDWSLDLSEISSIDRGHQALILAALSHAGGSHEHRPHPFIDEKGQVVVPDYRIKLGPLFDWPTGEPEGSS